MMIAGIGCDIVEIGRIKKQLHNEAFLKLMLSERERACCENLNDVRKAEWIAGRFAAKEAIYKAINFHYPCVIAQIEVLSDTRGAPICQIADLDVQVSISHEKNYAVAYAIAQIKE